MSVDLLVDDGIAGCAVPDGARFDAWVAALAECTQDARLQHDICIRVCTASASRRLNAEFRGIDKPTNVLSFPAEIGFSVVRPPLGDLAICWRTVCQEAAEQGKSIEAHAAHLTIHGVLHLLGYDHESPQDATQMERIEIAALAKLGVTDPYR